MRCVLAIVWNRNRETAETVYELSEQDFTKALVEQLRVTLQTSWWDRLKAVFRPPAEPDFTPAITKTFQDFKNHTILAHSVRKLEDRPEIDWRYTDKFRSL